MQTDNQQVICKSIFKNGAVITSKKEFTQKWIELINMLEKNKSVNVVRQ